jgi:hypothetical protein
MREQAKKLLLSIINTCMLYPKANQVPIFQSSSLFPFRHILNIAQGKNRNNFVVLSTIVFSIHKREN